MAQEFLPLCDILFNIISLALYFCDIVFDVITAYALYQEGIYVWFSLILAFVITSQVVSQLLSLLWYLNRSDLEKDPSRREVGGVVCIHVFQCGVLWRYFKLFIPVDFRYVKYEVRDLCVLRLVHAFCEAAPLLLVQLYLMWLKQLPSQLTDLNLVSTLLSLFNVCWALASFSKYVRRQNVHKLLLTWLGVIFQFFWRLGTVSSRAIVLTVYATVYNYWVFLVIGLHWTSMFLWLISPKNVFHGEKMSRWKKMFFSSLIAFIYTFCYINLQERDSRRKMITFYITMFLENVMLVAVWLIGAWNDDVWFKHFVLMSVFASFISGILFMLLYYRYFHVKRLKYAYTLTNTSSLRTETSCSACHSGVCESHERPYVIPTTECDSLVAKPHYSQLNGRHQHFNGGPYVPGVFNCRFNPALKRKKKKPTSFIPPPVAVLPSVGLRIEFYGSRMTEPFWKKPLPSAAPSENESSVGSRVNIQQKLQEKKQQQLEELRVIEEEIKQGKLKRPSPSDISESGTLRQPIPRLKKQPWLCPDPPQIRYVLPPPRKQRSQTPELVLTPHYLEDRRAYYESGNEPDWIMYQNTDEYSLSNNSDYSRRDERLSSKAGHDKSGHKTFRIPSDLDSQTSLPRSYTLPREFKYYRRSRSRKTVRSEHFVPSTNSSDGDVDSADEDADRRHMLRHEDHFHYPQPGRSRYAGHGVGFKKKLHETKL